MFAVCFLGFGVGKKLQQKSPDQDLTQVNEMSGVMERFIYLRILGLTSHCQTFTIDTYTVAKGQKMCLKTTWINDEFALYFLIDINKVHTLVV